MNAHQQIKDLTHAANSELRATIDEHRAAVGKLEDAITQASRASIALAAIKDPADQALINRAVELIGEAQADLNDPRRCAKAEAPTKSAARFEVSDKVTCPAYNASGEVVRVRAGIDRLVVDVRWDDSGQVGTVPAAMLLHAEAAE